MEASRPNLFLSKSKVFSIKYDTIFIVLGVLIVILGGKMAQDRNPEKINMVALSFLMVLVFIAAYQIYCIYKYDTSSHLDSHTSQARNIFEMFKKP